MVVKGITMRLNIHGRDGDRALLEDVGGGVLVGLAVLFQLRAVYKAFVEQLRDGEATRLDQGLAVDADVPWVFDVEFPQLFAKLRFPTFRDLEI
ncbi:MAG: hypothetical protein BWY17_03588 [Deltaproteobacteria bacterium ADurb.Bin207]|nr:MAG: hypothetical protein BWY17_03588 [Deltaproteobacteria bacterium ADurb.Bin207]